MPLVVFLVAVGVALGVHIRLVPATSKALCHGVDDREEEVDHHGKQEVAKDPRQPARGLQPSFIITARHITL